MIVERNLIKVNFNKGRRGIKPDVIVIHVMEGTMKGTLNHFNNPASRVSAHYGVSLKGEIVQYVEDEDTAWTQGIVDRPTAELIKEREAGPNYYCISIENEGTGTIPMPQAQFLSNVELIKYLTSKYNIPIDRRHIIGHREIRASKDCPGVINVDDLVAVAKGVNGPLTFDRVFKPGEKHSDIEALQLFFVRINYMTLEEMNTGVGVFGPKTRAAFRRLMLNHRYILET